MRSSTRPPRQSIPSRDWHASGSPRRLRIAPPALKRRTRPGWKRTFFQRSERCQPHRSSHATSSWCCIRSKRAAPSSRHIKSKQLCGQVFRFAVAAGLAKRDVTVDLRDALSAVPEAQYAAITEPDEVARLLRSIYNYNGQPLRYADRIIGVPARPLY